MCIAKVTCSSIQDEASYGRVHDIPRGTSDPPEHHQANSKPGVVTYSLNEAANSFFTILTNLSHSNRLQNLANITHLIELSHLKWSKEQQSFVFWLFFSCMAYRLSFWSKYIFVCMPTIPE